MDEPGGRRAEARLSIETPTHFVPGERQAARAAARRARDRRGFLIAAVSTVVVLGLLALVIFTSPGWPDVRETFFSSSAFKEFFPGILKGFWLDVRMFLVIEVAVLVGGMMVAVVRVTSAPALFPIRTIAVVYCDVMRGVPVVMLIYLFGLGIPALELSGVPNDPILLAGIALFLCYSAYVAEVYRAGIQSVNRDQMDAALAVGLTRTSAMRHVIIPQAVRRVGPPLLNDFISLQKDVALVSIIGIVEAFQQGHIDAASHFNYTPLMAAALLYLCVTIPLARLLDHYGYRGQATI